MSSWNKAGNHLLGCSSPRILGQGRCKEVGQGITVNNSLHFYSHKSCTETWLEEVNLDILQQSNPSPPG